MRPDSIFLKLTEAIKKYIGKKKNENRDKTKHKPHFWSS